MGKDTAISWTHHTFNPWHGCQEVSPGCKNCYARDFAKRCGFTGVQGPDRKQKDGTMKTPAIKPLTWGGKATARRFFAGKHWKEPLKWNRDADGQSVRPRVFCASMADVFEDREDLTPHLARLLRLIHDTPNLDWLLLTKRPEHWRKRMLAAVAHYGIHGGGAAGPAMCRWVLDGIPPANVWMGTSVEDQTRADERIPALHAIPARVRFLSLEPLLGPVNLHSDRIKVETWKVGEHFDGPPPLDGLHWCIIGAESGAKRRPFEIEWAEDIAAQCTAAGVPVHIKQDGGLLPGQQGRFSDDLWSRKEFPCSQS